MATPLLPGLDGLLDVCQRLGLRQVIPPASSRPPAPGALVEGTPLDPMLASVYSRMSKAILAADVAGISILQWDDSVNAVAERNRELRASWQGDLFARFVVFAGTPFLAHYFATVPGLADAEGYQPVVWVDSYEEGYALPLASNVDRFFDLYARYLESLIAHEDYAERGSAVLSFPWKVPHLVARDDRLVQLIEEGRFDFPQAGHDAGTWAHQVIEARRRIM
ncbi:hypothetical protein [Myxococcus sp. CA039A]|uniref:hypothetical protein n=1 Tax=Myxococcus sp. CA039A TaxID=2741737 RepID=UPI00157AEB09|nr:hypothetical protein [Myxococcus sp. CA039A]NTX51810.1 hypothetical protein [Myxococcus sp. CA039A]